MGHQVSLDLTHEVHRDNDHDQQRGAAEVERDVEAKVQEFRHKAHEDQIDSTAQGQAQKHSVDVAGGLITRTDARNERTTLLEVFRRFLRIENKSRVEIGEENNQHCVQKRVQRLARGKGCGKITDPASGVAGGEPAGQRSREQDQRRSKDRGNNTRHVHLERQIRALAAVDLVADLALGIVDGDSTLTTFDEDHEGGDRQDDRNHEDGRQRADGTRGHELEETRRTAREASNNTGEDDDRNTVPKTAFGDLFTEPHQEHRTRQQGDRGGDPEHEARIKHQTSLAFESDGNAETLEETQKQRAVARVLGDLASAGLAFLSQCFKLRQHVRQHLHDNRCRDVRHDAEREHREARQGATGEHVEQPENAALLLIEELLEHIGIDTWHRHMCTDAVNNERER